MSDEMFTVKDFRRMATRDVYGKTLVDLGARNEQIVVMSADLKHSNKLIEFAEEYPNRFFNAGIAEQNMYGIAAGLATCGKIPFISTFAPFATMRACEQLRTDIAYPNLNVKVVATHGGLSMGPGGTTHHATEDLAITRAIANLTVIVPADGIATDRAIRAAAVHSGPVYIRLGRGAEPLLYSESDCPFQLGKANVLKDGGYATVIATGRTVAEGLVAARELEREGLSVRVVDMHTIKPIDRDVIAGACSQTRLVVTVEEHNILGGLGGAVAEIMAEIGTGVPLIRLGIPDIYSALGPHDDLLAKYGLTAPSIADVVRRALAKR